MAGAGDDFNGLVHCQLLYLLDNAITTIAYGVSK